MEDISEHSEEWGLESGQTKGPRDVQVLGERGGGEGDMDCVKCEHS
jgi:hypothetical protein